MSSEFTDSDQAVRTFVPDGADPDTAPQLVVLDGDWHAGAAMREAVQIGPELLSVDVRSSSARGVTVEDQRTHVSLMATWRSGMRVWTDSRWGAGASLLVPVRPGPANGAWPALERLGLGLGVSWRGGKGER